MAWWSIHSQPTSITYPHAIVNLDVSDEAMAGMAALSPEPASGRSPLARAIVLRDGGVTLSVLHLSSRAGFSLEHATIIAHELSHLTARLLEIEDHTHDNDDGVLFRAQ